MRILVVPLAVLTLAASPALADKKLDDAVAKAEEQLQKGKPEEALKTLNKLVEQNPSAEALLALGRLQERLGELDAAGEAIGRARAASVSAAPDVKAQVLAASAQLALAQGTAKDALEHAKQAVATAETPVTLAALARAQVRTLQAPEALKTAQKAVAAGPTSAEAHDALAEALLAVGRAADASAGFRKALELSPRLVRARVRLAVALLLEGKTAEAVAEARKATEEEPKSGAAFAVLGTAILAENPKSWNDAIAQAQQGAFLAPRNPAVQVAVGQIFAAAGNFDQAANAFRKALDTDPGYGPARLALVKAQIARGDKEAALRDARQLATDMPGSGEAQRLLGELLLRGNEYVDAGNILERAVAAAPGSAETYAMLGSAYQFSRRSEEAASAYQKAVELAPGNTDYRTTYGLLLGITGEHEVGVAELRKVIATPGYKSSDAHVNLGWIYRNMKPPKTDESIAAYKKALEINPKEEQAALGLGWAYSYTRLWDESIAAFKKAAELDPKVAGEAYNGMAWCYIFKRDAAEARAFMQKAQAAGRNDTRLAENIQRLEKAMAAGGAATEDAIREAERQQDAERQRADRIDRLNRDIQAKNPAVRAKATGELARFAGDDAVPALTYMLTTDRSWDVRIAAANALGSIGPAAKSAVPHLKAIMNTLPNESINMTREEMEQAMKHEDLRRACRDALQKIRRG